MIAMPSADLRSREDEQLLGRRIQQGDEAALGALVEANMRVASYWAYRYRRDGVEIDDLIQEANIGLILAARHFDPERGVRFIGYARWWVEARLQRFLSTHVSVVRVGSTTRHVAKRLRRAEETLLQTHRGVTLDMVAREAGIDLATAEFARGSTTAIALSLSSIIGDADGEWCLEDTVADDASDRAFTQAETVTILGPLLEVLDARQRRLLHMRYVECRTTREIAEALDLSGSRVQQIEAAAMSRLRREMMFPQKPPENALDSTAAA